jgi:hypothetical protein
MDRNYILRAAYHPSEQQPGRETSHFLDDHPGGGLGLETSHPLYKGAIMRTVHPPSEQSGLETSHPLYKGAIMRTVHPPSEQSGRETSHPLYDYPSGRPGLETSHFFDGSATTTDQGYNLRDAPHPSKRKGLQSSHSLDEQRTFLIPGL